MYFDNPKSVVLFLGDATEIAAIKPGSALVDWTEYGAAELVLPGCTVTTGLDRISLDRLTDYPYMLVACAAPGGKIARTWIPYIKFALTHGMTVLCGTHQRLTDIFPDYTSRIIDFRHDSHYQLGNAKKRKGLRLLTVGQDGCIGKKYTSLTIHHALQEKNIQSTYCPTGQSGRLLVPKGARSVVLDTIPADFVSGAVEWLSPSINTGWQVIEGQGSISNAAWAAPAIGLLHGAQADALVMCVDPYRKSQLVTNQPLMPLDEELDLLLSIAARTNPEVQLVGISYYNVSLQDFKNARQGILTNSTLDNFMQDINRYTSDLVHMHIDDPESFDLLIEGLIAYHSMYYGPR